MGGTLPAAILIATLALMLGFTSRAVAAAGLLLAGIACFAASRLVPAIGSDGDILACWIGVLVLALLIYRPRRIAAPLALGLAVLAGMIAGLAQADFGSMAAVSLVVPARIAVERGHPVIPRVVASWLVAVALLAALLPLAVTHPGYMPEHRE